MNWLGSLAALPLLTSCNALLGLRDDYYVSSAGGRDSGASAGDASGGSAATDGGFGGTAESPGGGAVGGGHSDTSSAGIEEETEAGAGTNVPDGSCNYALTQKKTWCASSSSSGINDPPSALIDNTLARWSTGKPQVGGEWLQVDFGARVSLRRINLQQGQDNSNDYPRKYRVVISDTEKNLTGPVCAIGVGMSGVTTTIVLPHIVSGRYLLIEQTESDMTSLSWWSVEEIEVSCF